jgi:hypothetical protein
MHDYHATIMDLRRHKEESPRRMRNAFFWGVFVGLVR